MQMQHQKEKKNRVDACLARWWESIPNFVKALLFLVLIVGIALSLFCIWRKYGLEIAKFTAYLIGGGFLIFQVYVSNRRATAAEETAKVMQKTVELTEKGNVAERFKNAIEHLGNDSASIRLGGVYALHYIPRVESDYRRRVFEILCAHIRETTTQEEYILKYKQPSIEIQSILNLLFIEDQDGEVYEKFSANLESANLQFAKLNDAELKMVRLNNANLREAMFWDANLEGSMFLFANLEKTNLVNANLQNAILLNADLRGADLRGADFQGADLRRVKNLEVKQLLSAGTLYETKLPDGMREEVERENSGLFKNPDDEKKN